nr:hypothetical protein Iba_chr02dCG2550 [Ipomoea batatas]
MRCHLMSRTLFEEGDAVDEEAMPFDEQVPMEEATPWMRRRYSLMRRTPLEEQGPTLLEEGDAMDKEAMPLRMRRHLMSRTLLEEGNAVDEEATNGVLMLRSRWSTVGVKC